MQPDSFNQSNDLVQKDKAYIWHPYTQMKLAQDCVLIVSANGTMLYAEDGRGFIDAVSSWWTNIHGHAHPYIAQKLSEQAYQLEHLIFAGFTHRPAVELAERLLQKLPANQAKVFYSDNGSTAIEVALKMVFQYWHNIGKPKTKVIAFENAYHGDTFGAMAVSGRGAFTAPFAPFLFEVAFIPLPQGEHIAQSLQRFQDLVATGEIAGFIFEPLVQGTAGMQMYAPEVLDKFLAIARENEVLTIADEVMTGFGRTGKLFACDYLTAQPDLVCLSKGLTGGFLPLGVTTCKQVIYEAFLSDDRLKTFFHGHSYTANPLACTVALASLDLTEEPAFAENIQRISTKHQAFKADYQHHPKIQAIRHLGTILAVEIRVEQTSYFSNIRDTLYNYSLEQGVLLRPLGNILYVLPPYCITDEELGKVYGVIVGALGLSFEL